MSFAEEKAQEAKAVEVLTPVERYVASATAANFQLFEGALKSAVDQARACYGEDWIPAGEAQWLIQQMDQAQNFLALSETYFTALATPLMQAASLHIQHMQHVEATAPRELSAEERQMLNTFVGRWVRMQSVCGSSGRLGFVVQYDSEDRDYEIMVEGDVEPSWHERHCFELEG